MTISEQEFLENVRRDRLSRVGLAFTHKGKSFKIGSSGIKRAAKAYKNAQKGEAK